MSPPHTKYFDEEVILYYKQRVGDGANRKT